jgi:hypothetical protein
MGFDPGFHEALKATEPNKLGQMATDDLKKYEQYFAEQIPRFGLDAKHQQFRRQCQDRIFELRSERQHREVCGTGKKTLTWARVAGVVGIVAIPIDRHI